MPRPRRYPQLLLAASVMLILTTSGRGVETIHSHTPTRPLPVANSRPLDDGPSYFVDPIKGDDRQTGSGTKPWKTIRHGVQRLSPGDTLVLRSGIYREHTTATLVGSATKPITIRGYPNELAILDGGLKEFFDEPGSAWEPCPGGVPGEYRSVKKYANLAPTTGELRVTLLGNFADSMTPLHGYWNRGDLQSDNPYWNLNDGADGGKVGTGKHVYCGPGVWYDPATGHIHCRLAHTKLPGLGEDNYRGETDPRRIQLIIAPWSSGSVLRLIDSRHVRLQDLVLRGARQVPLSIEGGANLEVDGLTIYGGHAPMRVSDVNSFRMSHTACRGLAAPWTFRGSLKYRSIESRLFTTSGWSPTGAVSRNYEIAYCEFTDSVDGVFIGNVDTVAFHHNLVDNVSDDGLFVTAGTAYDGTTPGGGHRIYQNRFSRCLTTFAFGVGHGRQKIIADAPSGKWGTKQLGDGLTICRNVFDFRRPVMYHWPTGPDAPQEISSMGRFAGDHGSPGWEPMTIYHNTLLTGDPPRYEYGTDGFSRAMGSGTRRRVYNNIVCQLNGLPGQYLPEGRSDYKVDGNLLWSVSDGPRTTALPKPRYPRDQAPPPKEWTAHDRFADPQFVAFHADWRKGVDLRLDKSSPAIDSGVAIPESDRPIDPLRDRDAGRPDIGAIPLGVDAWAVGCRGRLDVFGNPIKDRWVVDIQWSLPFPDSSAVLPARKGKPAVIVQGYPAFDLPLIEFALGKLGVPTAVLERTWLPTAEYEKYGLVILTGSLTRARIEPSKYTKDDLTNVKRFLESGGTLLLTRAMTDIFATPEGRTVLAEWTGTGKQEASPKLQILQPDHPWVKHVNPKHYQASLPVPPDPLAKDPKSPNPPAQTIDQGILDIRRTVAVKTNKGERIIGTPGGLATLYRVKIGKGQMIYVGWDIASSLPSGRQPSTVADEKRFEEQMLILSKILTDVCSK